MSLLDKTNLDEKFVSFTDRLKQSPLGLPARLITGAVRTMDQAGQDLGKRQELINQRTQGVPLRQRIFRQPQQDENKLLASGAEKSFRGYGQLAAPAVAATNPLAFATNVGLGGAFSKLGGGSFAEGAKSAAQFSGAVQPLVSATNPFISKILPKTSGFISSRVGPAVANVAQGIVIDKASGQQTTPFSIGMDVLTGAVGGKGQFAEIPTPNRYQEILKQGKALGISGVSPRVNKVHPEDLDVMREFADQVLRRGKAKQALGELGVSAQRLAQHYFGGKWPEADNKKLAKAFEWAIDLNMNIPREARGQLPKLGIVSDTGSFSGPYKRGDLAAIDKKINELIGQTNGAGNYKTDYMVRQKTIDAYLNDPTVPRGFKDELQALVDEFDVAKLAKDDPTQYASLYGKQPVKEVSKGTQVPMQTQPVSAPINRTQLSGKQLYTPSQVLQENQTRAPQPKAEAPKVSPEVQQAVKQQNEILKSKVNLLDYARTPEKVLQKVGLGDQAVKLRRSFDAYQKELPQQIDKITKWYDRVGRSQEASQRIFQYLDGKPIKLDGEELAVANEMKSSLKDWADRLKLPEDKRVTNYITHIFEGELNGKEFDPDLEKIIAQNIPGSVYDPFLQKRYGIAGYKEDAFAALDAYVKRATRKANMDPALESLKKASEGLPKQTWDYIKSYTDKINMRPTDIDNLLDTMIKQSPVGYKLGQRPVATLSRNIRNAVYRGTLGLNVGSALRNLTQGANTYAELGEKYTAKGYLDVLRSVLTRSNELDEVGALGGSLVQDRNLSATKKAAERIDKTLFSVFEFAERINRGAAYFGAKARALAKGKSEQEAIQEGLDIARKTQFIFGSIDTPVALQGDIVKSLTQFQSYNIKQAEFLLDKVKKKEIAGLLRYAAAWAVFIKVGGEVLGFDEKSPIPFSNVLEGQSPVAQTPPFQLATGIVRAGIQGKDKYGNELEGNPLQRIANDTEVRNAAGAMIVPAYTQAKKTFEGIKAFNRGYSESNSGLVRYPIDKNQGNQIKTGIFGQYATKEAREYFDKERTPLSKNQSEMFKSLTPDKAKEYYDSVFEERGINKVLKQLEEGSIDQKEAESLIQQAQASDEFSPLIESQNKAIQDKMNSFTKKKVKLGLSVTEKELGSAYLSDSLSLPKENKYRQAIRNKALYSDASSISSDKDLTTEQKDYLKQVLAKELGVTKQDLDYYDIATQDDNIKKEYVVEQIINLARTTKDKKEMYRFLAKNRQVVNGKVVVSDSVINELEDLGFLSDSEAKQLKKLEFDATKQDIKVKVSGRGGGATLKSITPVKVSTPKVSLRSGREVVSSIKAPVLSSIPSGGIRLNPKGIRLNLPS